jgi:hypothetical protein
MTSVDPQTPPVGSAAELMRAGERTPIATAIVSEASGPRLVLDGCRIALDAEQLTLRWWDDDDVAWEARASVEAFEATSGRLTVSVVGGWDSAVLRQAARVDSGRIPVELRTLGGDGRVIRRVRAICLDLSPLGCRVAGTGPDLTRGDDLQVAVATSLLDSLLEICVDARVVRCAPVAFGGWQAGLEFLPRTAADRDALIAWRDSVAAASR